MSEPVEIGGQMYRIGRMDAKKKFHVARRLAPLLSAWSSAKPGADMMQSLGPIADALSRMSEEDTDYVLDACLAVCQREQPNGQWAPVCTTSGRMMFQDIDMPEMVQLAVNAVRENLAAFFPGAPADSNQAA
jgi:hypothetical protein